MKKLLRFILSIFWIIPIKENQIIFRSINGTKYNCNPKYICEYILKYYPEKYTIIWLFDRESMANHKYLIDKGIKIVNQNSIRAIFNIITSKYIIDNQGLISYIPIRSKQIVINTWHGGGAYKKELKNPSSYHKQYIKYMCDKTTKFITSSARFAECVLDGELLKYPDIQLKTGMPRNDIMFLDNKELIKRKVKKALNIPEDKRIVLYAPTFRKELVIDEFILDSKSIVEACEKRFGGSFEYATRFHPYVEKAFDKVKNNNSINTNDYEDMQELLCACDVLITDYSSSIWDASLAYIPCFIYASDIEKYDNARGFHTPINEWPFPLSTNQSELICNILSFDEDVYRNKVDIHHKDLISYDNGDACKKVVEWIVSVKK